MRNSLFKKLFVIGLLCLIIPFYKVYAEDVSSIEEFTNKYSAGGEITLTSDIAANGNKSSSKEVVIDLNGHTLNMSSYTLVITGKLTIKDTSSSKTGKVTGANSFVIQVGSTNKSGELVLDSGTIENTNNKYGVRVLTTTKFTMNNGTITARNYSVYDEGEFILNNGYIHSAVGPTVQIKGGEMTMNNGKVDTNEDGIAINMHSNCSLTVNGGEILSLEKIDDDNMGNAISMYKNTNLTITGGTITSCGSAVLGNGSLSGSNQGTNANVTVTGGTITSTEGAGLYLPQSDSTSNISGGIISGYSGIEVRSGVVNITGGTINGTYDGYYKVSNPNGLTTRGAALSVAQHTTAQPITVTVTGGEFNSNKSISLTNPENTSAEAQSKITINILNGEFNSSSGQIEVPEGSKILTGGDYNESVANNVADGYTEVVVNNRYYVSQIHSITVDSSSSESITNIPSEAPYRETVTVTVKEKEDSQIYLLITKSNNETIEIKGTTFTMPDSDITIKVVYKFIYKILEGKDQTYNGKEITIKTNGDLDKLDEIIINNEKLDEKEYELKSGSTILKLKTSYLDSLKPGTYNIVFKYNDGEVGTTIIIPEKSSNNPKTYDNILFYLILFIISFLDFSLFKLYTKEAQE